jgi:hypothetical protein
MPTRYKRTSTTIGPAAAAFPNNSVDGLLDAWLNSKFVGLSSADPEPISIEAPHPVKGGVTYVPVELETAFVNVLPFAVLVRTTLLPRNGRPQPMSRRRFRLRWRVQ